MRNGLPPVIFQVHASGMTTGNGNGAASTSFVLFTVNKESSAENNERYKKEYAEFIDIAAHDLDAPLRKLGVWVERLTAKYAHDETEEVQGYVQRISTSLVAMRSLLDDLAILSKLSLLPAMNDHCDLNGIVRDVLQELEPQVHEKKAVITCSALPVLKGDKKQYQLVFKNLLDNALKFTQKDIVPRIDITAEPVTAEEKKIYNFPAGTNFFKIEVADNGHGFSPELAGKIFRPFIRLQARSAFPGNGIGLAIVKRIIINHGGIIYVYSTENSGTRFIFILPETIDQNAQFP
jgi:signal transduction histidine kinase